MAKEELAKVQVGNQKYYNKRTRDRKLQAGDSVLLLLPTERNKLTLAWRGPYKVFGIVGDVDYRGRGQSRQSKDISHQHAEAVLSP